MCKEDHIELLDDDGKTGVKILPERKAWVSINVSKPNCCAVATLLAKKDCLAIEKLRHEASFFKASVERLAQMHHVGLQSNTRMTWAIHLNCGHSQRHIRHLQCPTSGKHRPEL